MSSFSHPANILSVFAFLPITNKRLSCSWRRSLQFSNILEKSLTRPVPAAVSAVSVQQSAGGVSLHGTIPEEKPAVTGQDDGFTPFYEADDGLKELPALAEPGSYGEIRAYSAFQNKKSENGNKKSNGVSLPEGGSRLLTDDDKLLFPDSSLKGQSSGTGWVEESEAPLSAIDTENTDTAETASGNVPQDAEDAPEQIRKKDEKGLGKTACSIDPFLENETNSGSSDLNDPPLPLPAHPPDYFLILDRAEARSAENEDGALELTIDEISQLLADPVFCTLEPSFAENLRKALLSFSESQES